MYCADQEFEFYKILFLFQRVEFQQHGFLLKQDEEMVQLNIGHLLQALIGCPNLTPNLSGGLIKFDHSSLDLPKINTCAPSVTFSRVKQLQEAMLNVIVGAYGFGNA